MSLRSTTNKSQKSPQGSSQDLALKAMPIELVKGVGPRLGAVFKTSQIGSVQDLFYFFPRTYEDRTQVGCISDLREGMKATLSVRVLSLRRLNLGRSGRTLLEARCTDEVNGSSILNLKWFYAPKGLDKRLFPGACFSVTGVVKWVAGRPEILHPEMTWGGRSEDSRADAIESDSRAHLGSIIPVYVEIQGVSTRTLRKILWTALGDYSAKLVEELPYYLLTRRGLPDLRRAIQELHFPQGEGSEVLASLSECRTPAHQRMIYGEFFKFEYLMLRKRMKLERVQAPSSRVVGTEVNLELQDLIRVLPFSLTKGQLQAVDEIVKDFGRPFPMNRLVQGDVGSGKTVVAFLTAAYWLARGGQVALMAPTEILAEQHYKTAQKLFGQKLNVALLTGSSTSLERKALQTQLVSGQSILVIGTHALLEEGVAFSHLAYVMIDEQHRFGVEQRRTLRRKGMKQEGEAGALVLPHSLILTATPIPRTLALTAFGDMAVTMIRDLPAGRAPIETQVVKEKSHRLRVYEQIRQQIRQGRQAYFIFPLVNESEAEGFTHLKSAVSEAQVLAQEVFPGFSVGLLHGQLSSQEKEQVMEKFKKQELQILVSTTVVEVGVDVPNSTVMVIEHAERFGLSQLHQLRGRVGRGNHPSFCFLLTSSRESARLAVLENNYDGFKIAEADLEIRGPGEFLGIRQAGALPFKVANLIRDHHWLVQAREDAEQILVNDPQLEKAEHQGIRYLSAADL